MKTPYKYRVTRHLDWSEIENEYKELVQSNFFFKPLLDLVLYIRENEYDKRLYAYTSMHKLVISIYPDIAWNKEALHIELSTADKWLIEYFPKPCHSAEFVRQYAKNEIFKKFDDIIKYLNW